MIPPAVALERAYRDERAAVLATLARHLGGDIARAEDAVQDAFVAAAAEWPRRGVPDRPGAWLTVAARRKAIDRLRSERAETARLERLVRLESGEEEDDDVSVMGDDRLRLIFTCCHPALAPEARIALTLRTLGGLTTVELARAFLVSEPAMQQRIVRAKRKIAAAGIPYSAGRAPISSRRRSPPSTPRPPPSPTPTGSRSPPCTGSSPRSTTPRSSR